MSVAVDLLQAIRMSNALAFDRRDRSARANVVQKILAVLRAHERCSIELLVASVAGRVPDYVVARVVKRLALRGLARTIAEGYWSATAALLAAPTVVESPLMP
jgi:hypothetical protein